ncbi:hypothetical protein QT381_10125 [Galbitalea sp. SE-J8]|uniref:DUF6716 putative glycosyltransferase n=1 Tax=Galbitalea sp. SE-J8 TaxID=3054952 RepID=UPI00259CCEFA|nr:DUF6716 putative glycosyltransferase [Galbitalea sp. SE-J8]MDM4763364.1 hypothetical protein [Galbitalea sp. SE-J8]
MTAGGAAAGSTTGEPGRRMRVLAVADSDSYVKWGAAMLDRMPPEWDRELVLLATPVLPSAAQLAAALAGSMFAAPGAPVVDLRDLAERVARDRPDVVLLSVRGPVVRVLVRSVVAAAVGPRPVIVSGLPGISIPETYQALYYRSQVDLVVLHSKREVRAFTELAADRGMQQSFALATLPFLPTRRAGTSTDDAADIVFAAQAKVPALLEERVGLVERLVAVARARPDRRVVLKLRGLAGEPQTHAEKHPLDTILAGLDDVPPNVVVSTGPMAEHLDRAAVLATVSSTAAVEAIALGVPVRLIDDFGVSGGLINIVFEGSGLFGPTESLAADEFAPPAAAWLDDNYLHAAGDTDWIAKIEHAALLRSRGALPLRRQFRGSLGGALRRTWDRKLALGPYDRSASGRFAYVAVVPVRGAVRRARALRARLRRAVERRRATRLVDPAETPISG